jgi:hypothetical protein
MGNRIQYDGLFGTAFDNVYEIINNRDNIKDPRDPSGERKFVYDADPLTQNISFNLLPYIFIENSTNPDGLEQSANGSKRYETWEHEIVVRTARAGSGNQNPDTGRTDMNTIINELRKTFNVATNRSTLASYNMRNVRLSIIFTDTLTTVDNKDILQTTLRLTYSARLGVMS